MNVPPVSRTTMAPQEPIQGRAALPLSKDSLAPMQENGDSFCSKIWSTLTYHFVTLYNWVRSFFVAESPTEPVKKVKKEIDIFAFLKSKEAPEKFAKKPIKYMGTLWEETFKDPQGANTKLRELLPQLDLLIKAFAKAHVETPEHFFAADEAYQGLLVTVAPFQLAQWDDEIIDAKIAEIGDKCPHDTLFLEKLKAATRDDKRTEAVRFLIAHFRIFSTGIFQELATMSLPKT